MPTKLPKNTTKRRSVKGKIEKSSGRMRKRRVHNNKIRSSNTQTTAEITDDVIDKDLLISTNLKINGSTSRKRHQSSQTQNQSKIQLESLTDKSLTISRKTNQPERCSTI